MVLAKPGTITPHTSFESEVYVLTKDEGGLTIRIKEGYKPNDVLRFFIEQQSDISGFTELLPSLNEIFIKLVEGTSLSRQFQPLQA